MIQHHVFGPVASRRLGVSLGIDLVPHKTCSLDCVYCEARRTTCLTTERKEYVPISEVLQELDQVLKTAPQLDFITFSGSGEPTLNSGIGRVVDFIKEHYPQYPVCLLTNGCSLGDREVRREIARISLEKLIADGRIHPTHIEEMVEKARREVEATIKAEGERAMFECGIRNLHPELVKMLGRLHYRTSYGQNVLQHSIEVSHIAGMMAAELGADVQTAKRAGLLHDLGKSIDHEMEGTHVQLGVEFARKYKEKEEIIHAIEAHHNDVEPRTIVACLVQAADAISAARPGARRENLENYIKRLEQLESIATSFQGVEKAYAIQAGREVRVMVKPEQVNEDQMVILARDLAKKIEEEMEYPGQIKVNLIRETKCVEYAK